MMGPIYWNPQSPTHLKKCSEFISNSCTDEASLGCCGVLPCSYCLEFHPYGEPVEYGLATFTGSSWSGTIAGASFSAFWDRGLYGDGECEFVVEIDGEEVYRESCYMGQQSCRDSSDEAEATIGYKSGTLIWIKREHRPLEYVEDFDTYCMEHFCDSCECSCKTLCLTIYDPDGTQTDRGELNDVAYACDPPKWEGRVGYFDLSLALERDLYGQCIIVGTVDGEEQDPVLAPGCTGLAGEIELYDGTRIEFVCKVCECDEGPPICCNRSDLPEVLYATITKTDNCTCMDWLGLTIELRQDRITQADGVTRWAGCLAPGPCLVIEGVDISQSMVLLLECTKPGIGEPNGEPSDMTLYASSLLPEYYPNCPFDLTSAVSTENAQADGDNEDSTCRPFSIVFKYYNDNYFNNNCTHPMQDPHPGPTTWELIVTE